MKLKILDTKITGGNRKIMVTGIVLLLLGLTMMPVINSIPNKAVRIKMQDNKQRSTSSEIFDPKMTIPEHCYNLSKAPSFYKVGDNLIAEEFNFPIGTFGNNYISYGPHGIDRIALYNNFYDALGGTHGTGANNPRCLNGTFLGVYMNDGEQKVSKLLQQYHPSNRSAIDYGLQPVETMECYSNIPIGYYQYQDSEFSAEIGLIVYSPVILYDIKNSSLPVSVWVYNAYNPTDDPIEVSFLFSLENDIGWRNKEKVTVNEKGKQRSTNKYTWQRTGTYNYIQEDENMIGIISTYDENLMSKSHPEYLGNMALATLKQPNVTISYISEWDTHGDGDDLLSTFSESGVLSNQNDSVKAIEGEHIYAGALCAKVLLEPDEEINIPFVLATSFPIFNLSNRDGMSSYEFYNWSWTKYFDDSWSIAAYSLDNYENWWIKINDWQEKLYSSGLPPEIMTFMIGSLSAFVSCVFFSEEDYWFTVVTGIGYLESADAVSRTDWFICMFYPEIMKYRIIEYCEAVKKHNGFCPTSLWNRSLITHNEPRFVIRAYRAWMWNQDDNDFLQTIYPACRDAIYYRMNETVRKDGLIHNLGNDQSNDGWVMPLDSTLNSEWLLSLKCMVSMANRLKKGDDAEYFEELFEKAQKSYIDKFWYKALKHEYFKLCGKKIGWEGWWNYPNEVQGLKLRYIRDSNACMIEQIIGAWHGRLIDKDILPLGKTKTALLSIYIINRDYYRELGWITSVMGNPPYRIDRFATSFFNNPNQVKSNRQWTLATSLLSHGYKEEGMTVAIKTKDSYLYNRGGGIYVSHSFNSSSTYGFGTNKINILKTWKTIKDRILSILIDCGIFGDKGWASGPGYPQRLIKDLPSWSFYQAASGFTPCVGGLKIKPRIGGDDVCYISQFAGCKIKVNVMGTGDYIESVEIDGEPYCRFIEGQIFIPLEEFIERDEMIINILL